MKKQNLLFAIIALLALIALMIFTQSGAKQSQKKQIEFTFFENVDTLRTEHYTRFSLYMLDLNKATNGDLFEAMRTVLDTMQTKHPDDLYFLQYKYRIRPLR